MSSYSAEGCLSWRAFCENTLAISERLKLPQISLLLSLFAASFTSVFSSHILSPHSLGPGCFRCFSHRVVLCKDRSRRLCSSPSNSCFISGSLPSSQFDFMLFPFSEASNGLSLSYVLPIVPSPPPHLSLCPHLQSFRTRISPGHSTIKCSMPSIVLKAEPLARSSAHFSCLDLLPEPHTWAMLGWTRATLDCYALYRLYSIALGTWNMASWAALRPACACAAALGQVRSLCPTNCDFWSHCTWDCLF